MFGSELIDVAIGLVFVYLMLSLICSVLNEWIAAVVGMRASNLETGIRNLLKDSGGAGGREFANALYEHPLIAGLFKKDWLDKMLGREGRPSYIPSGTFGMALLDTILPATPNRSPTIEEIRQAIGKLPASETRTALLALVNNADGDVQKLRQNIENWFNDAMDRVAGWYKRKSQLIILTLAIIVAGISNADSVSIVNSLWHSPALRASTIAAAEQYVKGNPSGPATNDNQAPLERLKKVEEGLAPIHLPLGWTWGGDPSDPRRFPGTWIELGIKILGLLFTAIALSLGAPFWFDVLNKFIVVRSTIKPREKSPEESSKDR